MNKFIVAVIVSVTLLTTGCTAVLIGGAGVGGYAAGKDERPLGVISSDISITSRVKATLIKDNKIDAFDINVDTNRGVVTLYGHVNNSAQLTRVIKLARTISGVKKVTSKLIIIK